MAQSLPRITVDFNNSTAEGLLYAVGDPAGLTEGIEVLADDGEGHECRAQVVRVEGELIYLDPDWETWRVIARRPHASTRTVIADLDIKVVEGDVLLDEETETDSGSKPPTLVY